MTKYKFRLTDEDGVLSKPVVITAPRVEDAVSTVVARVVLGYKSIKDAQNSEDGGATIFASINKEALQNLDEVGKVLQRGVEKYYNTSCDAGGFNTQMAIEELNDATGWNGQQYPWR